MNANTTHVRKNMHCERFYIQMMKSSRQDETVEKALGNAEVQSVAQDGDKQKMTKRRRTDILVLDYTFVGDGAIPPGYFVKLEGAIQSAAVRDDRRMDVSASVRFPEFHTAIREAVLLHKAGTQSIALRPQKHWCDGTTARKTHKKQRETDGLRFWMHCCLVHRPQWDSYCWNGGVRLNFWGVAARFRLRDIEREWSGWLAVSYELANPREPAHEARRIGRSPSSIRGALRSTMW